MRLFHPSTLIYVLVLGAFICFTGCHPHEQQQAEDSKIQKPTTGAYRALRGWAMERDYPFQSHSGSFFTGWQQGKSLQRALFQSKRQDAWQSIGPFTFGGRMLAMAFHPDNMDILYAGSASGGLWKSTTAGVGERAWTRVETGFPILGVGAIAINPENPDVMFIGTGEVYGGDFSLPGIGDRRSRGSYGMGILMSSDGGASWRHSLDWRYDDRTGIQDLAFDPNDPTTIWAATTHGVYVSRDNGKGWERVLDVPMATSLSSDPRDSNVWLAACGGFASEGHGIYRTTDGGASWTKIQSALPETFIGKAILDRAPSSPDIVYASIGNGSDLSEQEGEELVTWLLRSENGGVDWTLMNNYDYAYYQGWYSHFVTVDPVDPQRLVVAGLGPHLSSDGGQTLDPNVCAEGNLLGGDCHAGLFSPDGSYFYVASDFGIHRMSTEYVCEDVSFGLAVRQFYQGMGQSQRSRDFLVGTPQDALGWVYRGGETWEYFGMGHEGGFSIIHPDTDEKSLHGHAHMGTLDRRGDVSRPASLPLVGDRGDDIFNHTNFNAAMVAAPTNPDVIYSGRTRFYRSRDYAESWEETNGGAELDGNPILRLAVSYQNEELVYASTAPRYGPMHVFRTNSAGDQWTDITEGLPERWPTSLVVDPRDDQVVYITFSGYGESHLWRSTDGGQSWQDLDNGNLPDVPANIVLLDPDYPDHIYLGNDLGVVVSLDGGASWFNFSEGLPEATLVYDLVVYGPERLLRMGSHGNGAYERQLLEPGEVPVMQSTLVYPWISNNAGNFESTLIVNNLAQVPAHITLVATRPNGAQETVARRIGPGGMLAEQASTLFPQLGSGVGYSVRLTGNNGSLYGRWVTASLQAESGASPSQGVAVRIPGAGEELDERLGTSLEFGYLPQSDDFVSSPVVVNTGEEATELQLTFYNAAGMVVGTHQQTLEPGVPFVDVVGNLVTGTTGDVRMRATSNGGLLTGVSFVFNNVFNETAIGNASVSGNADDGATSLVYPWISNLNEGYESILVVGNTSDTAQVVTLTARRESGDPETRQREVPAGGFLAEKASDLFPTLDSGAGYSVELSAPTGAVYGQWVTNNLQAESGASPSQGVAVRRASSGQRSGRAGQQLLFGFLPGGSDYAGAPVLVNLGEADTDITLDFYNQDGFLVMRDKALVSAKQPLRPFAELTSQILKAEHGNLYLLASSSTEPITGVAFVFQTGFYEPAIGNAQSVHSPWLNTSAR